MVDSTSNKVSWWRGRQDQGQWAVSNDGPRLVGDEECKNSIDDEVRKRLVRSNEGWKKVSDNGEVWEKLVNGGENERPIEDDQHW